MTRAFVLAVGLALIGLLAVLTLWAVFRERVTFIVVVSLAVLAVLGVGGIEALTSPPPDE